MSRRAYLSRGQTESVLIRRPRRAQRNNPALPLKAHVPFPVEPFPRNGSRYALSIDGSHSLMENCSTSPTAAWSSRPAGVGVFEVPLRAGPPPRRVRARRAGWDNSRTIDPGDRSIGCGVNDIIKRRRCSSRYGAERSAPRRAAVRSALPRQSRTPRAEFFRKIGADPARQLIADYDAHRCIATTITFWPLVRRSRRRARRCAILVRCTRVTTSTPTGVMTVRDVITRSLSRHREVRRRRCRQPRPAEPWRHDVLADWRQLASRSIEACLFYTPVVNICFDCPGPTPFVRLRRVLPFTHYVNITRVERAGGEVADGWWRGRPYLQEPSLDAAGRRQVVRDQFRHRRAIGRRVTMRAAISLAGRVWRQRSAMWHQSCSGAAAKGGAIERGSATRPPPGPAWPRVHVVSRDHGRRRTVDTEAGVHYHFVSFPPRLDSGLAAAGHAVSVSTRAFAPCSLVFRPTRASSQPPGRPVVRRGGAVR